MKKSNEIYRTRAPIPRIHAHACLPEANVQRESVQEPTQGFMGILYEYTRVSDTHTHTHVRVPDHRFLEAYKSRAQQYELSLARIAGCLSASLAILDAPGVWWEDSESRLALTATLRSWQGAIPSASVMGPEQAPPAPPTALLHRFLALSRGAYGKEGPDSPAHGPPLPGCTVEFLRAARETMARCSVLGMSPQLLPPWQTGFLSLADLDACGAGAEGVTLRHGAWAFKVMDRYVLRGGIRDGHIKLLQELHIRSNRFRSIAPVLALARGNGAVVVRKPFYEGTTPFKGGPGTAQGAVSLLAECQRERVVLTNLSPANIVALPDCSGRLVYVDVGLDVKPYDHEQWLFMAKQLFCLVYWGWRPDVRNLLSIRSLDTTGGPPGLLGLQGFMEGLQQEMEDRRKEDQEGDQAEEGGPGLQREGELAGGRKTLLPSDEAGPVIRNCEPQEVARQCQLLFTGRQSGPSVQAGFSSMTVRIRNPFLGPTPGAYDGIITSCRSVGLAAAALPDAADSIKGSYRSLLGIQSDWLSLAVSPLNNTASEPSASGPRVALVVRCCCQDHATLVPCVRHLCRQLEGPHSFSERVLLCDSWKDSFYRQYAEPDLEKFQEAVQQLHTEGTITKVLLSSSEDATVREINQRWLGMPSPHTHCSGLGRPLTSVFEGLDWVMDDFCLLVDCDLLVARLEDGSPDCFLSHMLELLNRDTSVLGVSLPGAAPHLSHWCVPKLEVRGSLIHMGRLQAVLPLPLTGITEDGKPHFDSTAGNVAVGWNRLLDVAARKAGLSFCRWGSQQSFALHPDNGLKADVCEYMLLLDCVQQGRVPSLPALRRLLDTYETTPGRRYSLPAGSLEHFLPPCRTEELVLCVYASAGSAKGCCDLRRWIHQARRQTHSSWGVVLVVDAANRAGGSSACASDLDPDSMFEYAALQCRGDERFTVVCCRAHLGRLPALAMTARHLCGGGTHPARTILVPMDVGEVLLDCQALTTIHAAYQDGKADITLGRKLQANAAPHCEELCSDDRGGLPSCQPALQSFKRELFLRLGDFGHAQRGLGQASTQVSDPCCRFGLPSLIAA